MRTVRDCFPDRNRAIGSVRLRAPDRMQPLFSLASGSRRHRHPRAFSRSPMPRFAGRSRPCRYPPLSRQPKLLDRLRDALRARHYSPRTEQSYRHWVKRFHLSSTMSATRPRWLSPRSNTFLTHLAVRRR